MKYTSIIEKILCLGNLVKASWINLVVLGFALLLLLLLFSKKISKKICFSLTLIAFMGLLGYTIYQHHEALFTLVDNISNHFFESIYFPSVYVYLFVLIVVDAFTIGSLLRLNGNRTYKTINGICFLVINLLFSFILEELASNQIDVFSKASLFSNKDLVILLELSVSVFIVWLLSLSVISVTNLLAERIIFRKKKKVQAPVIAPVAVSVDSKKVEEDYLSKQREPASAPLTAKVEPMNVAPKNKFIPEFAIKHGTFEQPAMEPENASYQFIPTQVINANVNTQNGLENTFDLSSFIPKKQDIAPLNNLNNYQNNQQTLFDQILKNELPLAPVAPEPTVLSSEEIEKNSYTLNDYRIFNKMLKDIKEHNQGNSIHIDKNLEYRLITKYSTETYNMFKKMLKNYSN